MSQVPDGPPRHYVNQLRTHPTAFDLTLDFGQLVPNQDERDWIVGVTMTWEEARVLERMLTEVLGHYEQIVGNIREIEGSAVKPPDASQNGGATADPDDPTDTDPESDPGSGS